MMFYNNKMPVRQEDKSNHKHVFTIYSLRTLKIKLN